LGVVMSNSTGWAIVQSLAANFDIATPARFFFNGLQTAFVAALAAVAVYIVVSLLTCRQDYNLDKMLHRGEYALEGENAGTSTSLRHRFSLRNILKFDSNFTFTDKLVSGGIFWWAMMLLAVNVVISIWNIAFYDWPVSWWANYWMITAIGFPFIIAVATLVWFSIGGIRDIFDFFRALSTMKRDANDDGRVDAPGEPRGFTVEESKLPAVHPPTAGQAKELR
ncbi:MAG TPA: hypothetical protein PLD59_17850, partial [Tepidisphaeraceae bacterium]|nr:hypothetical protein [Tepidisphaeraceae bacterium]